MSKPFSSNELEATHILVVASIATSRSFYRDILGAEVFREYGGDSLVLRFAGSWLLLVTSGGPTPDKPDVTFSVPTTPNVVSHAVTLRVSDCRAAYESLRERGVTFLTPPVENGPEIRCFFRDPDGHLFELSEWRQVP
jgi:catechol 2,3-dioxygenase-like lactoylglutathione lyase family enzyme